ncbi:MAG TPA: TonB family protein [Candidatus Solibacter sp.]|nr:TonB family protein [Candidatus Solibacter sp.]
MQITEKSRRRIVRFLALSAALHLLVTATVLMIQHRRRATQVVEQPAAKVYPAMVMIAGGAKTEWTPKAPGRKKHPVEVKQATSDLAMNREPAPAAGAPVDAPHSSAAGNGADQQNADPAFPVFSPRPPVADRSLLPSENQEVVVDVKVSAAGDVLEATLVKGIGNALDQLVLDTVKTWRFHPATVNGSPVATEAELIFPFDRKYPTGAS